MEMDSLVELFCFYEKNMIGRREKKKAKLAKIYNHNVIDENG